MDNKTQERIKADAKKKYPRVTAVAIANRNGYIAGATAEHDRAQVLVDALEFVKNNGLCIETTEMINKAIEQWKSGNGVDDE